ncbi:MULTISPECIES: universal stress protein [Nocardia]|uniref:Universal stress protein n=1 Tax=Nocardia coubleae TaxID=356147 RepID=A0A846W009_9NOCA|nr:universal stress protein [Nocardia coubleae]NKX86190.1 universal stress protein [Nocardia coubleae]
MDRYQRIVVGTDGSEAAQLAVTVAGEVALRLGVPITALTVWKEKARKSALDPESAVRISAAAVAALVEAGLSQVTALDMPGTPSAALLEVGAQDPGTLLVIGARGLGRSKDRLTSSTANHVSHHSPTDVLFTHKVPKRWTTVGLATDGSPSSMLAVRRGYDLALELGARPFLVTATKTDADGAETLAQVHAALNLDDPELLGHDVLTGVPPAEALCNAAWKYDLVVIGNRGMSGPARLLGSVANKVTHDIDTNLLLVATTHGSDDPDPEPDPPR